MTWLEEIHAHVFSYLYFPGGAECFAICAKFCYGVVITINAHNVGMTHVEQSH